MRQGPDRGLPEGRFAIKFSTIAIFFIIFDIELLFIWPWADAVPPASAGSASSRCWCSSGILMLGFFYIWRKGGLEWE